MYIYKGLFLTDDCNKQLEKLSKLPIIVKDMHITFEFRPKTGFEDFLLGKEYAIKVIGEGFDQDNHGFLVELPEELKPFYKGSKNIHITVSLGSKESKASETGNLVFNTIKPFYVNGNLGYYRFYEREIPLL